MLRANIGRVERPAGAVYAALACCCAASVGKANKASYRCFHEACWEGTFGLMS